MMFPSSYPSVPATRVHPLLGRRLDLAGREVIYETDLTTVDYLGDHQVGGVTVFPATGYLELALAAGREAGFGKLLDVRELKIRRPLMLAESAGGRVQVVLAADGAGLACRIFRSTPGKWHTHATCRLETEGTDPVVGPWGEPQGLDRAVADHYSACRARGLNYGPAFAGLVQLQGVPGESWGRVVMPAMLDPTGYLVHPAILDASLQVTAAALGDDLGHAWLPMRVRRYQLARADRPVTELLVHCVARNSAEGNTCHVDISAFDAARAGVLRIDDLQLRRVELKLSRLQELNPEAKVRGSHR